MIALEDALESEVEGANVCEHAISRTGNNLKELIYYSRDRDQFIKALNAALAEHDRYPIETSSTRTPNGRNSTISEPTSTNTANKTALTNPLPLRSRAIPLV